MTPRFHPLCGLVHDPMWSCHRARTAQAFAAASNTAPVEVKPASNTPPEVSSASNKKQRWERPKYNEYMRVLMANRRAAAKGVA